MQIFFRVLLPLMPKQNAKGFTFHRLLWLRVTFNKPVDNLPSQWHSITMYDQQRMHITAEAKNPASCVTAGIARIPAPTYLQRNKNKSTWSATRDVIVRGWMCLKSYLSSNVFSISHEIWFASVSLWGNMVCQQFRRSGILWFLNIVLFHSGYSSPAIPNSGFELLLQLQQEEE